MTLDDRLVYCRICVNRKMDFNVGLVCSLTGAKPDFVDQCPTFKADEAEARRLADLEKAAKEAEEESGFFAPEKKAIKKGAWGGIAMMAIAVVWFIAGLAADTIFFYPPILFFIGLYALIKGLTKKSEQ